MTIGLRLEQIRGARSRDEMAAKLGVHKNTLANYETEKRSPDADLLRRVLEVEPEINPAWLLTGEGSMARGERPPASTVKEKGPPPYCGELSQSYMKAPTDKKRVDDQYCYIPLYNVEASAGGGAVVEREDVVDFLAFKAEWIRMQLNATISDLYLIHVQGESMEPTLRPGDVILINHREASTLPSDGIYVVTIDGSLLVKRLQRLPGGIVNVTSDNPAYQPFSVNLMQDNSGMNIVGRVVWCGRRM